jgi:hypothetical protein
MVLNSAIDGNRRSYGGLEMFNWTYGDWSIVFALVALLLVIAAPIYVSYLKYVDAKKASEEKKANAEKRAAHKVLKLKTHMRNLAGYIANELREKGHNSLHLFAYQYIIYTISALSQYSLYISRGRPPRPLRL